MTEDAAETAAELFAVAEAVMDRVPTGTEAEVTVTKSVNALTRFANGYIHQSVADQTSRVRLRLIRDARCGVSEAQSGAPDSAAALVATADEIRRHSPPGDPAALLAPDGGADAEHGYSPDAVAFGPDERATAVSTVCDAARQRGQLAFGTCEANILASAMLSSAGLRRFARHSSAELIALTRGDDGTGYAARSGRDGRAIDAAAVAAEAVERCALNHGAETLPPGTYEVILSPYAVAEMLDYLGYMGLGALSVIENRSFMRLGETLMSDSVTIADDVTDSAVSTLPFDGEGATTTPVTLIDSGVGTAVVHDSVTASLMAVPTTGHSLPQPNSQGPLPRHLTMAAGAADTAALIAGCPRGLLVTRFWYLGIVHPLHTILTGMTRDGTFLIENGAVSRPVRDLRFTQSVVDALSDVRGVGAERLAVRGFFGATLAPWLHLGRFTFTS